MPETLRPAPSPAPILTPSPQGDYHTRDSSPHPTLLGSSESVPSTATLSGNPPSAAVGNLGDITGAPLVAEPESLGTVSLAATPVTFISGLRYSRRDKLYVVFGHYFFEV